MRRLESGLAMLFLLGCTSPRTVAIGEPPDARGGGLDAGLDVAPVSVPPGPDGPAAYDTAPPADLPAGPDAPADQLPADVVPPVTSPDSRPAQPDTAVVVMPDARPPDIAPPCMDACTRGEKRCQADGVQTCNTGSAGCTVWEKAKACPQPKNATASCGGMGVCSFACDAKALVCSDTCQIARWNFESGTNEGAVVDSRSTPFTPKIMVGTPLQTIEGTRALVVPMSFTANGSTSIYIRLALCPSGNTTDISKGRRFHAAYFFEGPPVPGVSFGVNLISETTMGLSLTAGSNGGPINAWNQIDAMTTGGVQWMKYTAVTSVLLLGEISGTADWTGTLWLDDIVVE